MNTNERDHEQDAGDVAERTPTLAPNTLKSQTAMMRPIADQLREADLGEPGGEVPVAARAADRLAGEPGALDRSGR